MEGLCVRGAVGLGDASDWGPGMVVLLGPSEPAFWDVFTASPEYADTKPDPLDRWSKRTIGAMAKQLNARAVYPSDGPPYPPFLSWATDSGRAWVAPPGLLVHRDAGLLISYRGALILDAAPEDATGADASPPCSSCDTRPCTTACPVGALGSGEGYDVPRCAAHVRSKAGTECRERGCLVRRACPVSARMNRPDPQAAFHMSAFLGSRL